MVDILGWIIERIADLLPSAIKSRLISKEDRTQKHLSDIKQEVLEPMLRIFDDIYIPVLESKNPIIEYSPRYVQGKEIDVRQYSGKHEHELKVVSPERWTIYKNLPKINQNLYLDIKENHYKDFISSYEKFGIDFDGYGNKWLSYAIEIQKTIENELGMPLFDGDITKASFVEPGALASYLIERVMVLNSPPVNISKTTFNSITFDTITVNLRSNGSPMALKGTHEDVQMCVDLVNRLIANEKKYERLYPKQENLLKNAILLRSELDKIIKTYKLLGKCNYV